MEFRCFHSRFPYVLTNLIVKFVKTCLKKVNKNVKVFFSYKDRGGLSIGLFGVFWSYFH